jgi:putative hydrolase of HD superfamily
MQVQTWRDTLGTRLDSQITFLMEADRLKTVLRASHIADNSRRENTAEHSWHITVFAITLAGYAVGPVDIGRVVQMLILHDIVEIDTGDTPLHDGAGAATQAARESEAADRLFGLLPPDQARQYRALWDEFEAAVTPDSRFAKAIDRLQPILLNHAVGGGTWKTFDIDESMERAMTRRIEDGSPELWRVAEAVFADAVAKGWLRP